MVDPDEPMPLPLTYRERRVIAASLIMSMTFADTLGEHEDKRDLGELLMRVHPDYGTVA